MKEQTTGSGNGASLSVGAPLGYTENGGLDFERKIRFGFIRIPYQLRSPIERKTKVLVTDISLHRGPAGDRGTGLVYQGL